jgi:hypothetical protein
LLSGKGKDGVLFEAEEKDPSHKLVLGSKFSLAWITQVAMKSNYLKGSVSAPLGVISVDWSPTPLALPKDVSLEGIDGKLTAHGPLPLQKPTTCRFMGPPCYIENAPFETTIESFPALPQVAVPFEVSFRIKNKTALDQKLRIILDHSEADQTDESNGIMISGLVNGEISLSPNESHILSYTVLATRVGKVLMPKISVASDRYKTWVLREASARRSLFVLP